jgi:hypothetical protein
VSYNIDSWEQIGGEKLRISKKNAAKLRRKFRGESPEIWFVDDLKFGDDDYAEVDLGISSEGSGNFFREHMAEVAKVLEGEADFFLTWEGGDSHSGLRIRGGKAYRMEVVFSLREGTEKLVGASR